MRSGAVLRAQSVNNAHRRSTIGNWYHEGNEFALSDIEFRVDCGSKGIRGHVVKCA